MSKEHINFRAPIELKNQLQTIADKKHRKLSHQIIHYLENCIKEEQIKESRSEYKCRREDAEPNRPAQGKKDNHAG